MHQRQEIVYLKNAEQKVKDICFLDIIDEKSIELASAMGVSVECARGHILEAMREHSEEEKARYKKDTLN
jgi:hypothetical protein